MKRICAISPTFIDLGLSKKLADTVDALGYETPTPIQSATIPLILMGRDILGSAQTGTGKTASFTLPMIDILDSGRAKARMPRSLIIAPTRELAAQVSESFNKFSINHKMSMALLIGGVSFSDQEDALNKGVDVLIATPGRLLDHFERGKVLLQDVKILVIDEADRMLDMGFIPDVMKIVGYLPVIRQTLFFSATLSDEIHTIGKKFVMNPKIIEVSKPASTAETISQSVIWTNSRDKRDILCDLLGDKTIQNALIFCNRKRDISTLLTSLKRSKFNVAALHGDMTQSARLAALHEFKEGSVPLLIASDVAARGLDIPSVSHVFNYDVPVYAEDYVHRIGRTGRAGRSGIAITFAAGNDDKKHVQAIETLIGKSIPQHEKSSHSNDPAASPQPQKDKQPPSSASKNETSASKSEPSASNNESSASKNETSASKNETSASKNEPSASKNETSASKNETSASKNEPSASKKPSPQNDRPKAVHTPKQSSAYPDERQPPEWTANSFKDSDHIPDFLR